VIAVDGARPVYGIEELLDPELKRTALGYVVRFLAPPAELEFENVRDDRGQLSADFVARRTDDDVGNPDGHLFECNFRLLSLSDQSSITTALRSALPGIEWRVLLNRAIHLVRREMKDESTSIILRDAEEAAETPYLAEPLALRDHSSLLVGEGGTAKSLTLLAVAGALHEGIPGPLGLRMHGKASVLYLDFELDETEHRKRLRRLFGGRMPGLAYLRCARPLVQERERIQREAARRGSNYLIIDSVSFAVDGPLEEAATALRFFGAIRQLGMGSVAAAHVSKMGNGDDPFGSAFWRNGARQTWKVKAQRDGENRLTIGMFDTKRNLTGRHQPLAYTIDFEGTAGPITVRRTDARDHDELSKEVPLKDRIDHALSVPKSYAELAEELDAELESIRRVVNRNMDKLFTKVGEGAAMKIAKLEWRRQSGQSRDTNGTVPLTINGTLGGSPL
jgi:hypothetical protein